MQRIHLSANGFSKQFFAFFLFYLCASYWAQPKFQDELNVNRCKTEYQNLKKKLEIHSTGLKRLNPSNFVFTKMKRRILAKKMTEIGRAYCSVLRAYFLPFQVSFIPFYLRSFPFLFLFNNWSLLEEKKMAGYSIWFYISCEKKKFSIIYIPWVCVVLGSFLSNELLNNRNLEHFFLLMYSSTRHLKI